MKKVLLVSMPMGAMERPALGLSLLKARLNESGFKCDVRYLTFAFAEFIGHDDYQWMCYQLPYTAFAGEWSFTEALYGARPEADSAYVQDILRTAWQLSEADIARILHIRSMVPYFMNHCLAAVPVGRPTIVGFTSTFEQNIASLALAKQIKKTYPRISIVFGNAGNWEGRDGAGVAPAIPLRRLRVSGEAEEGFPGAGRAHPRSHARERQT